MRIDSACGFRRGGMLCAIVAGLLVLFDAAAQAPSIWDAGVRSGAARTEFAAGIGTAAQPLDLRYDQAGAEGCLWDAAVTFSGCPGRAGLPPLPNAAPVWAGTLQGREACGGDPTRVGQSWQGCTGFAGSPTFALNDPGERYWVLHANDDPSFDQCNAGPPGLSNPVRSVNDPAAGAFRFDVVPIPPFGLRQRLEIGLDLARKDYFCSQRGSLHGSIPFLSAGVQRDHGNPGAAGRLQARGSARGVIAFDAALVHYAEFGCTSDTASICTPASSGVHAGVYAVVAWAGLKRLVFVDLYGVGSHDYSAQAAATAHWNWPIAQSFFFPGAEAVLYVAGAHLEAHCGLALPRLSPAGPALRYRVDFGRILACARDHDLLSAALPEGEFDLDGVHWYVEGSGTRGRLTLQVSGVETLLFTDGFD